MTDLPGTGGEATPELPPTLQGVDGMPKQGLAKRVWNAMKARKQPAPALSEEDIRIGSAIAKLRYIGIVEKRVIHFKASIVLHAVFQTYKRGITNNYTDAFDNIEKMTRRVNNGQLPLDEQYAIELARRALEPGGLEDAQSWIEAAEAEVQGTSNSLYTDLIPTKGD